MYMCRCFKNGVEGYIIPFFICFYIFLGCDPLKGVYLIGLVRVSRHTSSWSFGPLALKMT